MNQTKARETHFYHNSDDSHSDEPNKRKGTSFLSQMTAILMEPNKRKGTSFLSQMTAILMNQTNAREPHFYHKWQPLWWREQTNAMEPHFYHKWQPLWWTKQTQGNLIFITNEWQPLTAMMNQTNARELHFYHKWQPLWWSKQTQGNLIFITDDSHYDEPNKRKGTSFLSQMTAIMMNQTNAREPHFYHKWQPFWWIKQTQWNLIFITNDSHYDEANKRKGTSFLSQMTAIMMNQTNAREPHFYHKWQPFWWTKQTQGNLIFITNWQPFWRTKQTQGNLIFITNDSHSDESNKRNGTSFLSQMTAIMRWTKQTQGNLIFITDDSHYDEPNKRKGTSFLSQMTAIMMKQTNAREPHFYHKWQPLWWSKQTQGNLIFITDDSHYDEPNKRKGTSFLSQMIAIMMNQTNAREPHFYQNWQPFWWTKQTQGNLIFITNDSHSDEPNKRKGTHFYHKWQPFWWTKQTQGNLIFITNDSRSDEPNKRKGTSFLSQMTAIMMNQTKARETHFYHKWQPFWWTKQTQGNLIFITNGSHSDGANKRKGTSFLSQMTAILMNQTNAREPHFYHKWQPFWWTKQTQGNFIFITNDTHYDEANKR